MDANCLVRQCPHNDVCAGCSGTLVAPGHRQGARSCTVPPVAALRRPSDAELTYFAVKVDSRRHDHWICSSHSTEVVTVAEAHERVRGRSATVADFERLAAVVQSAAFSRTCAVIHGVSSATARWVASCDPGAVGGDLWAAAMALCRALAGDPVARSDFTDGGLAQGCLDWVRRSLGTGAAASADTSALSAAPPLGDLETATWILWNCALVPRGLSLLLDAGGVQVAHSVLTCAASATGAPMPSAVASVRCNAAHIILALVSSWDARVETHVTEAVVQAMLQLMDRCAPGPCLLPTAQAVIGTVSSLLRHPTLAPRVDLDAASAALTAAARTSGAPFPRHLHDEVVTVLRLMKLRRQGGGGTSVAAATVSVAAATTASELVA